MSVKYIRVLVRDFRLKTINPFLSHLSFVKLWNLKLKTIFFITDPLNLYYHSFNVVFSPKGHATLFASLFISFDWLNSFKNHYHTHCVFFDLSKAFESVSHRKL